ncbi:MAG: hypothetical protein HKP59_05040 [Lutibacter sp.]|uniref:curli-like amyloid fiber formation chaperone CsgH n=1 Tax=Lutibacter sp. TaxID=1925666 RepID=UPI0017942B5D|nr:curli-like amyloid fiber formation chaperone CsgH [Lutibacter sp.]MBT8316968.1 curli production assembly/transport protein CsgE [Lutibacter sp.]NNJ57828.1 hypothetical protein [Lutibacter sp.]
MGQLKIHIILCCLLLSFNQVYSQLNETVTGRINIQESDNLILIKAQVENEEPLFKNNLFYNLLALKKTASGNYSNNRQEGEFSLNPGESKTLSEIRLNKDADEELRIYLFIKQEDKLIAKDSIYILPQKQQQIEKSVVREVDFELKGIVVDEVITKIGKDFHDYFYQDYLNSGTQYPFIITITEKPYFATSSIISVKVDDRIIHEFISKPDEEYLKSNVKITLQNLSQYSKQRKMLFRNSRI